MKSSLFGRQPLVKSRVKRRTTCPTCRRMPRQCAFWRQLRELKFDARAGELERFVELYHPKGKWPARARRRKTEWSRGNGYACKHKKKKKQALTGRQTPSQACPGGTPEAVPGGATGPEPAAGGAGGADPVAAGTR